MSTHTAPVGPTRSLGALLAVALFALALNACGVQPVGSAPTTTVAPTSPTTRALPTEPAAAATITPASEPTAVPEPAGLLPAPLISNQRGQLYRLAVDGVTTTQLTDETPPEPNGVAITDFDVSPADGSLVYVVQQITPDNRTTQALIRADADGSNRTVLLDDVFVTAPRFSPDGARIAFGVYPDLIDANPRLAGGVYSIPAAGGEPELVQANDPFDPAAMDATARAYSPSSWSPDGSRLLLQAFLPGSELCETALKALGSDGVIRIAAPEGTVTSCRSASWAADGQTVYIPLYGPGMFGAFAGLARVDAARGTLSVPVGDQVGDSFVAISSGLLEQADGSLLGFVATSPTPFPSEPDSPQPSFALHAIGLGGQLTPLRGDSQALWGPALWAADGSGAVIPSDREGTPRQVLAWVPADGQPAVELVAGELFGSPRWGR